MQGKHHLRRIAAAFVLTATAIAGAAASQTAVAATGDLLISEYIEGSSNNKALEIYNGTGAPVDLVAGGYTLERCANGCALPSQLAEIPLSGTIADGDVYVVANPSANPAILAAADTTSGNASWNGDDGVVLRKNGVVVDAFGQVGVDPGSEWPGGGQNDTLRRKASICAGDTNELDPFDASVEWDTFPVDTTDGLGTHTANCGDTGGGGTPEIVITEIMYNPASSEDDWEWVEIANVGDGPANLAGWVIDDNNSSAHPGANIVAGSIPAGGSAVLYNTDDISASDFADAWGSGMNLIAVTNWSAMGLNNGGDTVGLWDDFASYAGDHTIHANAVVDISYDDSGDWPTDDGAASIYLTDLAADGNVGTNWALSGVGDVTPVNDAYQAIALGGNSGADIGSPSANPPTIIVDPVGVCGDPATFIHYIQGADDASTDVGNVREIEGIVVGDFQDDVGDDGDLNGFYVQEEDGDADSNTLTSEGIFVFQGDDPAVDVAQGDHVRVRGVVSEFFGLTEISSSLVSTCSAENGLPTAASITLPVASVDDFEAFEGMRVTFPQTLHATGNFTQARYGEVDLSVGGPLDNPTNVVAPGPAAVALQDLNNRSRIQLDDGSSVQNPLPLPPYLGAGNTLRTGDTVDNLTAIMSYGFGLYELQPITPINFTRVNERLAPPDVGGSITIAAYNVLNYFTTLDGDGSICGPEGDQGCRGADTETEFEQQRAKLVAAISELDADIVGLMEIENNAGDGPTADLVAGLNDATYAGKYDYIATGPVGDDAIKVAIIFQPESVSPLGSYAVLDSSVDPTFNDEKNRAVLAQTFSENGTDDVVTVAVNHLKSKGSNCDNLGDPDVGDGQGNCNLTREAAAAALATWLNGDPTGVSEGQSLIIGDLNSYAQEDPIVAIENGGYTDLIESFVGTGFADGAYSFNFFSQSGYLDHGLASPAVLPRVTGASFWHVNADEPSGLDYNNFNQPGLFAPDAFRSSDHDPVVIGVCETTPPVVDVSVSPETMSPPNHKMFSVEASVSIVDADPNPIVNVSVTSNEPDNGLGDGDHPNDIVIIDDDSFELRAERSGLGDGRVYTITYDVTDACGNTTTASATVTIPHNSGPKGNWK